MNCIGFPQCGQRSVAWFVFMLAWPGHEAEGIASVNIAPRGLSKSCGGGSGHTVLRVVSNVVRARKRLKHDLRLLHLFCTLQGRTGSVRQVAHGSRRMSLRLSILSALLLVQIGVMPAGAQAASQSNETIALSVGASETIALSEKPSTGYEWQLDTTQSSNLAIVRVVDAGYQAVQGGTRVGKSLPYSDPLRATSKRNAGGYHADSAIQLSFRFRNELRSMR